jgi:hypothetical protein
MSTTWTQQAGMTGEVDTDNLQDIVDQAEAHATDSENSATASANSATSAASSASSASTSATNAGNSAISAANSATSASASATSASNSATSASTSATNAAASETAAAGSATDAEVSATNAAASESSVAANATAAATSETNAANSATSAANSATSSATSATESASSATAAADSATAASASETAAATSETNAATSATNSASSATSASTSATAAANSATSAATSATNAANSESNASDSETNASASEANALASASSAETSATASANSATASANSATAASASETSAATSASNAASSESAAALSESNASGSATSAATSATSASNSATAAADSATSAATSASNASTSASNAATSEANAATSESNAANSATAASTSETNASASASSASTSASNASTSEANAATSASQAATSASNASTSETNAATSATTATTKASEASTSATNAATSESNAATSASAAASSASSASASADAALAALDSFDDRYLGQKASDPTVDNDGNTLIAGALYFNMTDDVMKVYEGSTWVAAYASLSGALLQANNLSDVQSVTAARTNLGLGTAATTASTDYATAAQGALADSALQSFTETDPVFTAWDKSTGITITESQISDFGSYQPAGSYEPAFTKNTAFNKNFGTAAGTVAQGNDSRINNGQTAYGWGDHGAEGYLTGNQTITLTGDVSGSGTTSIAVTIADDSHNHTIANVDGLQTALDGKVDDSQVLTNVPAGAVFTDTVYTHPSYAGDDINLDTGPLTGATVISDLDFNVTTDTQGHVTDANATYSTRNLTYSDVGAAPSSHSHSYISEGGTSFSGTYPVAVRVSANNFYSDADVTFNGTTNVLNTTGGFTVGGTNTVFHDGYHPNADKWTTARTLSLTGDVTGSVSWDGSGNASLAANCVYADAAGTASNIDGITFRNGNSSNGTSPNNIQENGHSYINSVSLFGQTDGALYSQAYSTSWVHQIYGDYRTGNMAVRGRNNGSWTGWSTVWTSSNDGSGSGLDADTVDGLHASAFQPAGTYNTIIGTDTDINTSGSTIIDNIYVTDGVITSMGTRTLTASDIGAAPSSHTHSYLPLSGGTVTGVTSFTNTTDSTSTTTGAIKTSGGIGAAKSIYAGGNVTAYSDKRLKTNIEVIPDALIKVCSLSGYTYDRTDMDLRQTGVIAQEVLAVLPEAVTGSEDGLYGVNYGSMVGILIEAVKELTKRVEELESK